MNRKTIAIASVAALTALMLTSCTDTDADVASANLSKAAEQFEIDRRIVAINTITDKYLFVVEGKCSIEFPEPTKREIVCKLKDGSFVKHHVDRSDNVTLISEQTNGTSVSTDHYRVIFKPEAIIPNVDRP